MGWGAKLIIIPSTGGMNIFWNNNIYDCIIVRGLNPGVIYYITRFSMIVQVEVVLNSTVVFDSDRLVLCTKIWTMSLRVREIASSLWAIALVSQQFLTSVVSVSADCGLLMKCKVIQSILIYMSCNHTCSRTELLERQIIYFVSSLHEMSVCILLQWELFFM